MELTPNLRFIVKLSIWKEILFYLLGIMFIAASIYIFVEGTSTIDFRNVFLAYAGPALGLYLIYISASIRAGIWYIDFSGNSIECRKGFYRKKFQKVNLDNIGTFSSGKRVFIGIFEIRSTVIFRWRRSSFWVPLNRNEEENQILQIQEYFNQFQQHSDSIT